MQLLHRYYVNSKYATVDLFYDPARLNILKPDIATAVRETRASGSRAPIWLAETSSSWGGGAQGLSDRYAAWVV